jgi:hypothetical protein
MPNLSRSFVATHRHAAFPASSEKEDTRIPLLAYAVLSHNARLVDMLLSFGADPNDRIVDVRPFSDSVLPEAAKKRGKEPKDLRLSVRSSFNAGELRERRTHSYP